MHTLVRITTGTEATPGAKRRSLPINPKRPLETPVRVRKIGCGKRLTRIQPRPQELLPRLHSRKVPVNRRSKSLHPSRSFQGSRDLWTFVKALIHWAAGKRLTDRLPKLSLIPLYTLPPLERTGYSGQRVTNTWFQFLGIQKYFSDS